MSLVAGQARVTGQQAPHALTLRRLVAAFAVGGAAVGLFAGYLRVSATFAAGSDGASNALEAWDLLHGNWLLRGWTLTDVSFYTTELPEYAIVELARGLGADAVHISAAITYTLLVLAAAALARGRARGGEGWARALIAAGIMLAPQLGNGVHVLLSQPDHVGTQVPVLAIFLLIDRAPRRWYTAAAIWVLLTATVVADKIAIVDTAAPLALVGLAYAIWPRANRTGGPAGLGPDASGRSPRPRVAAAADALRRQRFELALAVAACCAVGAAELIITGISRLGGFALMPVQTGIVAPGRIPGHLSMTLRDTLNLFGADVGAAQPGPQTVLAWLHAPGIALAAAALVLALWRIRGRQDLVTSVLAVGLVVTLADFVASTIPSTPFDTRELAAALPYGAALAGRVFGPWLTSSPRHASPGWRSRLSPAAAVLALAGALPAGRARLRGGPAARHRPRAAPGRLAGRPPPDHRARHLQRRQHHHARQRRRRADADGHLAHAGQRRHRGPGVPVVGVLVRPPDRGRELRGHRNRRRHRRPHPAGRDPRAGRTARPHLPLPVLHDHGLEQEPARAPGLPAVPPAGQRRPPLTRSFQLRR